jgi:transposase
MMRVGLYRPVHVKTLRSQKLRMLLNHRKLLQSKTIAIENDLRATLRNFGLKVGMVGTVRYRLAAGRHVGTLLMPRMVCTACGLIGAEVRPDRSPHTNARPS